MIVIDTNVALSLVIQDVLRDDLIKNQEIIAPAFIKLEVINILRKYHTLHKIPKEAIDKYYLYFLNIILEFVPDESLIPNAMKLSFELNHPVYDCLFLSLAVERKLPFMTLDKRLMEKAKSIGLETISTFH